MGIRRNLTRSESRRSSCVKDGLNNESEGANYNCGKKRKAGKGEISVGNRKKGGRGVDPRGGEK